MMGANRCSSIDIVPIWRFLASLSGVNLLNEQSVRTKSRQWDRSLPELGSGPLLKRLTRLTRPAEYDTTYLTHGIHPYAAKYIPQLPRLIITEHTNERNIVLDPFCGSGTTLLECALLGRRSVGVDSHPIATLIAQAKTNALSEDALSQIRAMLASLNASACASQAEDFVPKLKGLQHWFQKTVITELSWLRSAICRVKDADARTFLECILSSIIVSVSNQESETRYASVAKAISPGETIRRFAETHAGTSEHRGPRRERVRSSQPPDSPHRKREEPNQRNCRTTRSI